MFLQTYYLSSISVEPVHDYILLTGQLHFTENCNSASFTVDNGKEFASHQELAEATGMKVYFCEPYSPWQRGTNENTNGLLRQFFPKGTSFPDISDDDLQLIVDMINNRPRKRLNYLTPFEVLKKFFS